VALVEVGLAKSRRGREPSEMVAARLVYLQLTCPYFCQTNGIKSHTEGGVIT